MLRWTYTQIYTQQNDDHKSKQIYDRVTHYYISLCLLFVSSRLRCAFGSFDRGYIQKYIIENYWQI